jgi:hypothetical protein
MTNISNPRGFAGIVFLRQLIHLKKELVFQPELLRVLLALLI